MHIDSLSLTQNSLFPKECHQTHQKHSVRIKRLKHFVLISHKPQALKILNKFVCLKFKKYNSAFIMIYSKFKNYTYINQTYTPKTLCTYQTPQTLCTYQPQTSNTKNFKQIRLKFKKCKCSKFPPFIIITIAPSDTLLMTHSD